MNDVAGNLDFRMCTKLLLIQRILSKFSEFEIFFKEGIPSRGASKKIQVFLFKF